MALLTSFLATYTVPSSDGVKSASAEPEGPPSGPGVTSTWFVTLLVDEVSVIVVWYTMV